MSFATDLWDGYTKVVERVEAQIAVMKDFGGHLAKRAKFMEDHGKHLAELCKAAPGNPKAPAISKTEETLNAGMMSIVDTGKSLGDSMVESARAITTDVVKPLEVHVKSSEKEFKKVCPRQRRIEHGCWKGMCARGCFPLV